MRNIIDRGVRSAIIIAVVATFLVSCKPKQEVVETIVAAGPDIVARWKTCRDSTGGPTNQTILENSGWADGKLMVDVKDNDYCGGTVVSDLRYTLIWLAPVNRASGVLPVRQGGENLNPRGDAAGTAVATVDQADIRALVSRKTVVRHGAASL